ncbi:MAG TPA: alpha/beta hydrolase [Chloroflexia bacterium]|nr:alpha/beta hydrolase [Chloroflexia bacterium]
MKPDLAYTPDLEKGGYAKIGGFNTHYHLAGEGPTIVFVHGSGPGVSAWANWRLALPELQKEFTVAALDVVGFGYTERPEHFEYSARDWADHVISFIEALGVGPVHLVGNSMGGGVALQIAHRRPELINKMVLMGTTGCHFEISAGLDKVWRYKPSKETMMDLLKLFLYNQNSATPELAELRYKASIQPGFQESWERMFPLRPQGPHEAPEDVSTFMAAEEPEEGSLQWRVDDLALEDSEIAAIKHPSLVIHGREDQVIPIQNAYKVFDLLENAELHIFGKCGHWTQIEHKDGFNRLVGDFFKY